MSSKEDNDLAKAHLPEICAQKKAKFPFTVIDTSAHPFLGDGLKPDFVFATPEGGRKPNSCYVAT